MENRLGRKRRALMLMVQSLDFGLPTCNMGIWVISQISIDTCSCDSILWHESIETGKCSVHLAAKKILSSELLWLLKSPSLPGGRWWLWLTRTGPGALQTKSKASWTSCEAGVDFCLSLPGEHCQF